MKILLYISIVIFTLACNAKKKTTTIEEPPSALVVDSTSRFIVSFISIGEGTDYEAKKQFKRFVETYNLNNKTEITYSVSSWGREGEIDYCFTMEELASDQQIIFIQELKEALKSSTLIRYKENSMCR